MLANLLAPLASWTSVGFFGLIVFVFGFAPGAVLRVVVRCYPADSPRRQELLAELYEVPRLERPFWVAEQTELAIFEGLGCRLWNAQSRYECAPRQGYWVFLRYADGEGAAHTLQFISQSAVTRTELIAMLPTDTDPVRVLYARILGIPRRRHRASQWIGKGRAG